MITQEEFEAYELWGLVDNAQSLLLMTQPNMHGPEGQLLPTVQHALTEVSTLQQIPAWRFPTPEPFQDLNLALQNLIGRLEELDENPDLGVADEFTSFIDLAASSLLQCPAPISEAMNVDGLAASMAGFSQSVKLAGEANRRIRETADDGLAELEVKLENLGNTITQEEKRVTDQSARLDKALTDSNSTFSTELDNWKKAAEKSRKDQAETADKSLKRISDLEIQARKLVQATSRHSISTEYGQHAQKASDSATRWSVGAVVLAVLGLIVLGIMVGGIESATPAEAIWKTSLSFLTLAVASYMAGEAAGHRRDSRVAKRIQLDLNALGPFLADFPRQQALELQKEFAQRIFTNPPEMGRDNTGFAFPIRRRSAPVVSPVGTTKNGE